MRRNSAGEQDLSYFQVFSQKLMISSNSLSAEGGMRAPFAHSCLRKTEAPPHCTVAVGKIPPSLNLWISRDTGIYFFSARGSKTDVSSAAPPGGGKVAAKWDPGKIIREINVGKGGSFFQEAKNS